MATYYLCLIYLSVKLHAQLLTLIKLIRQSDFNSIKIYALRCQKQNTPGEMH